MKYILFLACFFLFPLCGFAHDCFSLPVPVPEATPQAINYYKSGNILWILEFLYSMILPALIVFTGFGEKLRTFCEKISKKWLVKTALYTFFFLLIITVLTLPLDYFTGFVRPHSYGMSNQSFGRWLSHYSMNTTISTLLGIVIVWILYGVIRKSPKRWWLYLGLLNFPLSIMMIFIQPIWIAPLFNHFGPMKDKVLEQKIMHLAERAGIENSRIYEVDMSADTNKVNAYVTGIGASKRIVIWDTAIKNLSEEELLFVIGHEMGHYVLHHLWWGMLVYTSITTLTLLLVYVTSRWFIQRWSNLMGFQEMKDIDSLPLIFLLYAFYAFLTSPLENKFSQMLEHNADTFGLELTHLNEAAATGFVKLSNTNLGYPWPGELYMTFRAGHPSIGARITFFNEYKPWCHDQPLKYSKFFTSPR